FFFEAEDGIRRRNVTGVPDVCSSDLDFHQVGADTGNHYRRASTIRRFISRTASVKPVKTARPMMAWPIFSSTSSAMAAMGWTLRSEERRVGNEWRAAV